MAGYYFHSRTNAWGIQAQGYGDEPERGFGEDHTYHTASLAVPSSAFIILEDKAKLCHWLCPKMSTLLKDRPGCFGGALLLVHCTTHKQNIWQTPKNLWDQTDRASQSRAVHSPLLPALPPRKGCQHQTLSPTNHRLREKPERCAQFEFPGNLHPCQMEVYDLFVLLFPALKEKPYISSPSQ